MAWIESGNSGNRYLIFNHKDVLSGVLLGSQVHFDASFFSELTEYICMIKC